MVGVNKRRIYGRETTRYEIFEMGGAEIRVKWIKESTLDGKPTPDTDQYTDIWNKCRLR